MKQKRCVELHIPHYANPPAQAADQGQHTIKLENGFGSSGWRNSTRHPLSEFPRPRILLSQCSCISSELSWSVLAKCPVVLVITERRAVIRWCVWWSVAADAELRYDPASLLPLPTHDDKSVGLSVVKCEPAESTQDASGNSSAADWYHCQTCDIYFRNVVMYTIHAGAHSRRNPLECNVCGRVSRDCFEFAAHLSYGDHCRVASSHP